MCPTGSNFDIILTLPRNTPSRDMIEDLIAIRNRGERPKMTMRIEQVQGVWKVEGLDDLVM